MSSFNFKVLHQDRKTSARVGEINTPHGIIHTPAFVPVGTQASVKSLTPDEIKTVGTEIFFVNTYHMTMRPGIEIIRSFGGLHKFMSWSKPLMTDSGGFQVFSLARNKKYARSDSDLDKPVLVKIGEDGVIFRSHWDGAQHEFTPHKSMELQFELGSDIHIAFDDCTPFPMTEKGARKSMERTHRWAKRSLQAHENLSNAKCQMPNYKYQALYGVVQGSVYENLRKESADFVTGLSFDGIAIGGVSVGESKKDMLKVCDWVIPRIDPKKPRHLLGVGEIDDIFEIIERGIDTFDCVQPTRMARMGRLFVNAKCQIINAKFEIDITKVEFANDQKPIDPGCLCYSCKNFSKGYIHHLFKVRELLAYRLATIHNLHFVFDLVNKIRVSLKNGSFTTLKAQYIN